MLIGESGQLPQQVQIFTGTDCSADLTILRNPPAEVIIERKGGPENSEMMDPLVLTRGSAQPCQLTYLDMVVVMNQVTTLTVRDLIHPSEGLNQTEAEEVTFAMKIMAMVLLGRHITHPMSLQKSMVPLDIGLMKAGRTMILIIQLLVGKGKTGIAILVEGKRSCNCNFIAVKDYRLVHLR